VIRQGARVVVTAPKDELMLVLGVTSYLIPEILGRTGRVIDMTGDCQCDAVCVAFTGGPEVILNVHHVRLAGAGD
jgi:hypothetical protein